MSSISRHLRAVYEIQVEGELDEGWQQWFDNFTVQSVHTKCRPPVTTLAGTVADQSALRGILCKLWDLNLVLISVRRAEVPGTREAVHE